MFASIDYVSLAMSARGAYLLIPSMLALIPAFMTVVHLLIPPKPEPALWVKTAKNGRLYAHRRGYGIVWSRKGETSEELLDRARARFGP